MKKELLGEIGIKCDGCDAEQMSGCELYSVILTRQRIGSDKRLIVSNSEQIALFCPNCKRAGNLEHSLSACLTQALESLKVPVTTEVSGAHSQFNAIQCSVCESAICPGEVFTSIDHGEECWTATAVTPVWVSFALCACASCTELLNIKRTATNAAALLEQACHHNQGGLQ